MESDKLCFNLEYWITVIGVGYGWAQVGFLSHKSDYSLFERSRKDMKLFGYYQQYING